MYFGGEDLFPLLESLDKIFGGGKTGQNGILSLIGLNNFIEIGVDNNFFLLSKFLDGIVDNIALGVVVVDEEVDEGLEYFLQLSIVLQ